jgi:hypothetical protein
VARYEHLAYLYDLKADYERAGDVSRSLAREHKRASAEDERLRKTVSLEAARYPERDGGG